MWKKITLILGIISVSLGIIVTGYKGYCHLATAEMVLEVEQAYITGDKELSDKDTFLLNRIVQVERTAQLAELVRWRREVQMRVWELEDRLNSYMINPEEVKKEWRRQKLELQKVNRQIKQLKGGGG